MKSLEVIFFDTNKIDLNHLLGSTFLSDANLEELSRFKMDETKKEKACSFILKNRYVRDYHVNEFDKPVSDACYFNVSHSKGLVVFIKDEVPVGIDIEKVRPVSNDLIDYISSIEENKYIKSESNFYEVWTNKESLSKCIGTGIKDKIKEIPALPINGKKEYKNKVFYCSTINYGDAIISITRENEEPFAAKIVEEKL